MFGVNMKCIESKEDNKNEVSWSIVLLYFNLIFYFFLKYGHFVVNLNVNFRACVLIFFKKFFYVVNSCLLFLHVLHHFIINSIEIL